MSTRARLPWPVLPALAPAPTRFDHRKNDLPKLRRYLARVAEGGPVHACYEASGAGYVLHRALTGLGVPRAVIAPSLIPTKPGVQRKYDRYDAAFLDRDIAAPATGPDLAPAVGLLPCFRGFKSTRPWCW